MVLAALVAVSFLNDHGWDVSYPYDEEKDTATSAAVRLFPSIKA
jgi:hypothetical protein